ncbi:hypothetical protein AAHB60_06350 [Pseudomonas aeruginosa]
MMKPLIMKNMSTPTAPPPNRFRAQGFLCVDVVKHKSEMKQDNDQGGNAAQVLNSVEHFFPFCKCADQPRMIPAVGVERHARFGAGATGELHAHH